MIASIVLVCLLLVSSAASQERVDVIVLQSNGAQCPPADQYEAVRNNIIEKVRALIRNNVLAPGSFQNPATSCVNLPLGSPSGNYWIQNPSTGNTILQYCDNSTRCSCSAGGWMRVANLDMTDQNQQCPFGLRYVGSPRRSCGRPDSTTVRCASITFPVNGVEYSRVCGRIIGYQYGGPNAFRDGPDPRVIDDQYVEGVSLTHGSSPRKHIWTFAAALQEALNHVTSMCQCTRMDIDTTVTVPSFVGEDYFCETGSRNAYTANTFYEDDPLWDGEGCGAISTCCNFNNPPWFCKQLPQPTSDDIELRLCGDEGLGEDTPIEIVEIYIK